MPKAAAANDGGLLIERAQTGVRMEKKMIKVLKALAEYLDLSLGDLLERIVLHAFEGKDPFSAETRKRIGELKSIYGLELDSGSSHRLIERGGKTGAVKDHT
jgi:predicted DNA-binding ribbon-helix-helix protein